jgi:hypothetical protein
MIACIVLLPPVFEAGRTLFHPATKRELRPVLEYIKTHQRPGDVIYINIGGSPDQFKYYAEKYGFPESGYIFGFSDLLNPQPLSEQNWQDFRKQSIYLQKNQRVWFLFSGLNKSEKTLVSPRLDQIGQKIDYFNQPGISTYLYQLQ